MARAAVLAALFALIPVPPQDGASRVTVLPVFVVPAGAREPAAAEQQLIMAHVRVAQARYAELLGRRDSFLVEPAPLLVRSAQPLSWYRAQPENASQALAADVLAAQGVDRWSARHVYVIILVNDADRFPVPGGRPLNGGLGTGAGLLVLSTHELQLTAFQATLQHELGHGFGLVHADNYGEDMASGRSLMSYNPAHWTRGLEPSATPGTLLPVELAALALNRRVFPRLAGDKPAPPPAQPGLVWLPPMAIPGQVSVALTVTSRSGDDLGSAASRLANGRLRVNAGPGVTYDAATMWHSPRVGPGGWVALDLAFPAAVTLTGIGLHTEHSGQHHRAEAARLERLEGDTGREVAAGTVARADCLLAMAPATGRAWRLWLRAGASGYVTVRGLEFRDGAGRDIYPPLVREVAPARQSCDGA